MSIRKSIIFPAYLEAPLDNPRDGRSNGSLINVQQGQRVLVSRFDLSGQPRPVVQVTGDKGNYEVTVFGNPNLAPIPDRYLDPARFWRLGTSVVRLNPLRESRNDGSVHAVLLGPTLGDTSLYGVNGGNLNNMREEFGIIATTWLEGDGHALLDVSMPDYPYAGIAALEIDHQEN